MTDAFTVALTEYQREEVRGLLAGLADDIANGEERTVWGRIDSTGLVVLDATEAADDVRYRARVVERERRYRPEARAGAAGARSLRGLAKKIEDADRLRQRVRAEAPADPFADLPWTRS